MVVKVPKSFSGEVVIKTIRRVGAAFGGIIFTCRTVCPRQLRFIVVADHKIARLSTLYRLNHTWYVEGEVNEYKTRLNNGETKIEWQIKAAKLSFRRANNENLIGLLKGIAGIGAGKAKVIAKLGNKLYDFARNNDVQALALHCSKNIANSIISELREYEALGAVQLLDELGLPTYIADRVLNIWGTETFVKISANPYILISFEANLALLNEFAINRLDFNSDSPERLEGYVKKTLYDGFANGNTCLPETKLKMRLSNLLNSKKLAVEALEHAYSKGIAIKINNLVQVGSMHIVESTLAENISKLKCRGNKKISKSILKNCISEFEKTTGFKLTNEQCAAVSMACNESFMLLTGSAGCGKTTILKGICNVLEQVEAYPNIVLLALSGKAALRITESTELEAKTISSFLFNINNQEIKDNSTLIIDEASMVDVLTLNRILKRIPLYRRVILVGDPEQLPPIGVGLTLHNLVHMGVPQIHLSTVKRQSEISGIPFVANVVRNYKKHQIDIEFSNFNGIGTGVSFIETKVDKIHDKAIEIYQKLGGNGFNDDIVILSPIRSTPVGVLQINNAIHEKCIDKIKNRLKFDNEEFGTIGLHINMRPICMGELLMSKRNDYQKGIRNGSVGKVIGYNVSNHTFTIDFNNNLVDFTFSDLPYLEHAICMTVHKSQGSQYKRVIIVVKDCNMLDKHLLYTAITRATEQVVLIGSKDVFYKKLNVSKALERKTLMLHYFSQLATTKLLTAEL